MPVTGGTLIPHSQDLWDRVRDLVIEGKPYKQIAELTGLKPEVIMTKASVKKWTAIKAQKRQEAQLESLRPHLHQHLHQLTKQVRTPKTNSAKQLKPVADLVLALANGAKLVEGWKEEETQCLVNVLQISNSVTANPDVGTDTAIDAQIVESTEDYSI